MQFTPLIVTQLWTSICKPMNSRNPLELQDFVPIFAECSGGCAPSPPSNTNIRLSTTNTSVDLSL